MRMALLEDQLEPGATLRLPKAPRLLYLARGAAQVDGRAMAADTALFTDGAIAATGSGTLWRFEVTRDAHPEDARSGVILSRPLRRDPSQPFLLRLDRVTFSPGVDTPRHGHFGQGIRRLIEGHLLLTIDDRLERRLPGEAWFETGEEPVVARGFLPGTSFLRALVMDAGMQGQSSFRAWTPEDAAKPRGVTYRMYLDEVTRLG
jgi:quercetin dioxygenase-like cupin family protein